VDDGIATGANTCAALRALKRKAPKALILAVPVAPAEAVDALKKEVDEIVCLSTPQPFFAIGMHYLDFHQVSDAEGVQLLAEAGHGASQEASTAPLGPVPRPRAS
jgi:putative phosphoribosyl transferase